MHSFTVSTFVFSIFLFFFFFQAEDGIRDLYVTGVQTCALPIFIYSNETRAKLVFMAEARPALENAARLRPGQPVSVALQRSEEHTSELQSRRDLVCRLLLEKKKKKKNREGHKT